MEFRIIKQHGIYATLVIVAAILGCYWIYRYCNRKEGYSANREHETSSSSSKKVPTLMLFYADWCPACTASKPEWNRVKEHYNEMESPPVKFVEYNCSNAQDPAIA
jgi:thiol-disulfide isomerase/thioredoxin